MCCVVELFDKRVFERKTANGNKHENTPQKTTPKKKRAVNIKMKKEFGV